MQTVLLVVFGLGLVVAMVYFVRSWSHYLENNIVNKQQLFANQNGENLSQIIGIEDSRLSEITRDVHALLKLNDGDIGKVFPSLRDNYHNRELIVSLLCLASISSSRITERILDEKRRRSAISEEEMMPTSRNISIVFVDGDSRSPQGLEDLINQFRGMQKAGIPHDADDKIRNNMAPEIEEDDIN